MSRRGWNSAALARVRRRGAGGEAPAGGGVTHPLQSAGGVPVYDGFTAWDGVYVAPSEPAPPPPPAPPPEAVALPLDLPDAPPGMAQLYRWGPIVAFDPAELEGADPDSPVQAVRPAALRLGVPPSKPGGPVCVARGADTVHLAVYAHLEESKVAALVELLRLVRESHGEKPTYFRANGQSFEVVYTRSPYAVALDSRGAHIRIMRARRGVAPQVFVELRSSILWRDGLVAAVERMLATIRAWETPRPEATRVDVSRIDLAADFVGLSFDGTELPQGRWVCRALERAAYPTAERVDGKRQRAAAAARRQDMEGDREAATYVHGRTHTGGYFGTGSLKVRYYRKDLEIKKGGGGKSWMKGIWSASGWDGKANVWRVELQARGAALASMVAHARKATGQTRGEAWQEGAVTYGKGWRSVLRHLDALWRYAVGEPNGGHGWLTLRDPTLATQPTRWPVSAQWHAVQAVPWGEVAEVYGAEAVGLARIPARPSPAHLDAAEALERGKGAWLPKGQVELALIKGELTPELVAHAVAGPDALADWGPGPAHLGHSDLLRATGRACWPPMDLDAMSAEQRVKMLEDQLLGTAQALAAARELAARQVGEAEEQIKSIAARLVELGTRDLPTWRTKARAARAKASLRGAIAYRLEVVRTQGIARTVAGKIIEDET